MIDRGHALSVTKQAEAAGIARSTVYYLPRPVSAADLELMRQIDRLHLEFPFAGARMLRGLFAANGSKTGRRRVKTLMKRMGIEALYRCPRTTKPEPGHTVYPYLLRGLDITYIPMAKGFVYLAAVRDWFSRRVLSWRVLSRWRPISASRRSKRWRGTASPRSSTPTRARSLRAAFTGVLAKHEIKISMDGKGAWRDNVFVERLWRTVKYEEVYLHAYDSESDARTSIGRYLIFTIAAPAREPDGMTPDQAYYGARSLPPVRLAA